MADISEWDPVDDGNTHAPPNGWPEFMQPSAVNNAARAMMGAVRRWYDTVASQISGINTSIATKVNRSGDTMTGGLSITAPLGGSVDLHLSKAGGVINAATQIYGETLSVPRWLVQLSTNESESGGNVGSNFAIHRYADNGTYLGSPFNINRSTGAASFAQALTLNTGGTVASHATRKDYVDQRDNDIYNAAWTNITGWASGQDQYYYNAAVTHANNLDSAQRDYIDNKDGAVLAVAAARVSKGGDTMTGALSVPYIYGGAGGAGNLRTYFNSNTLNFRWDAGAFNYGVLFYRIDEAREAGICDSRNFWNIGVEPGGGGPVGWVFGGRDASTWFYFNTDFVSSDERIKSNIAQSQIDALGLLSQVQLSQFDIKPEVAAWCQSVGKEPEERTRMMRDAQAAHVDIGFVAQQVKDLIPEAVFCAHQRGISSDSPLPNDLLTINQQMFVPYLVRAVQQLQARIEALEGRP